MVICVVVEDCCFRGLGEEVGVGVIFGVFLFFVLFCFVICRMVFLFIVCEKKLFEFLFVELFLGLGFLICVDIWINFVFFFVSYIEKEVGLLIRIGLVGFGLYICFVLVLLLFLLMDLLFFVRLEVIDREFNLFCDFIKESEGGLIVKLVIEYGCIVKDGVIVLNLGDFEGLLLLLTWDLVSLVLLGFLFVLLGSDIEFVGGFLLFFIEDLFLEVFCFGEFLVLIECLSILLIVKDCSWFLSLLGLMDRIIILFCWLWLFKFGFDLGRCRIL